MEKKLVLAETLDKSMRYQQLIPQLKSLVEGEHDLIANLANLAAGIKHGMGFFWVGFYFVQGDELVLGPFQGPVACTRIPKGKGVCGKAWELAKTIVVGDVDKFPGHIACSSESRSEIVLPVLGPEGKVTMVLDIDSEYLNFFDDTDKHCLQEIVSIIESLPGK